MMKSKINIYIIGILLLSVVSCDIDDVVPQNALNTTNVVRNEKSANEMLADVYYRTKGYVAGFGVYTGLLVGELVQTGSMRGAEGFATNQVQTNNESLLSYYTDNYNVINQANWLIYFLEAGDADPIDENRKNAMLADAKILRAMCHFNLLRTYGQFYDTESELGVVIRMTPTKTKEENARNTVQECYDTIIADLEFGIANATEQTQHFYMSKTVAKALLAKVYLYKKDYKNAVKYALEVINNTVGYSLESSYKAIFTKRFESSEVLYAPYVNSPVERSTNSEIARTQQSQNLQNLADMQVAGAGDLKTGVGFDPRFAVAYVDNGNYSTKNGKYPFNSVKKGNTTYFLRLAEIYLIYAEAKARLGNNVDSDALAKVNAIRNRAGVKPLSITSKTDLLKAIRTEKTLELFAENGESWYDLVRYATAGDVDAKKEKSTLTSKDQFILPIPLRALQGNSKLKQNPGYY